MANYYASDSDYGRRHDRTEPSTYGRSYERADPSVYGRSQEYTDPRLAYGGYDQTYGSDRNSGTYPASTHASGWSTTKEYDTHGGNRRSHKATPKFDEYVTKMAKEYIRPTRSDSLASSYQRSSSPSKYGDYGSKESYKPGGYPVRGENYDAFSNNHNNSVVPTYASNGVSRPSHGSWNTSSGHHSGQLSNPTNDIGTAVRFLEEASKTVAPGSRIAETTSKVNSYVERRESVEPAKRYGSYNNLFVRR
ncbi:hypothetical protein CDL15_Pgr020289 [Punica granatum]|uniref:Uncharacterized protein n=1 Tax=Punica granatum TaxID=22663 RepID=A0A218VR69_PUNGR|nr:hypothetical protein CDL15_Pgr020289 [Punica granatum]PKI67917.1 hypothetical protein CRG98_011513 [Punica granatum]